MQHILTVDCANRKLDTKSLPANRTVKKQVNLWCHHNMHTATWTTSVTLHMISVSPTVMTPVAAVTPASPNRAVAASVTNAVAAMFTTLPERGDSGSDHAKNQLCNCESFQLLRVHRASNLPITRGDKTMQRHPPSNKQLWMGWCLEEDPYVVPMRMVVRKRVTSWRSKWNTPPSPSFSANSRTWKAI